MDIKIENSWKEQLAKEFDANYFKSLTSTLRQSYLTTAIFPQQSDIFNAFKLCPFDSVKVVILGQDPYHNDGQAHGLAFSVPNGVLIPPSLKNIFIEVASDTGATIPNSGNLERWAKQGLLLLNSTLSVEAYKPGSHIGQGWEQFTDAVIREISDKKENVVFLLWGAFAINKSLLVDESKHLILTSPHPSPLSAYRGFLGCKHFSKTNVYLRQYNKQEIIW